MKKNRGITVVALVITIIILLILIGISINALTNTKLFGKTKQAQLKSEESLEREAMQLALYNQELNKYSNMENTEIGQILYDKNVQNGTKWHIIVDNNTNQVYGTGYRYLAENTIVGDIKLKNSWIVNESNQNMIKLENSKFVELSYQTSVGVTEGLIFNLDPSVIENATKENINEKLGEDVELVNFDWNENSGLTKNSFNLDGINDYIKIKYDNKEEKNILAQNGFTFEFYGIYDNGTSYYPNNDTYNDAFKGFFCYWDGRENIQATLRFGIRNQKNILWNAGDGNYVSDYSYSTTYPWNIIYPENDGVQAKKEVHFTISVDCSQEEYVHTMYINGNKTYSGKLNKEYWEYFVNKYLDSLKYFCVGRSSMGTGGRWHYSKMNAYSIKLYNRGLNEQEVKENYDKSVAYHNLLQK